MKIEKLTTEQQQLLSVYKDRWMAHGLSTEPLDENLVTHAVHELYGCANLPAPSRIVYCDSPLSMVLTHAILKKIPASVRDSVRASVWASVGASVYGQHDAAAVGFYSYFNEVLEVAGTEKINGLRECAENCGWLLPCADTCLVSRRPTICKLNQDGVIHSEDGPAIAYVDGFQIHAWNGTTIPSEWIESEIPEPGVLLQWDNVEQRRAGCEIIGWHNMLDTLNAKSIDKHPDPQIGHLYEVDLPDSGRELFLKIQCGTGRTFATCVTESNPRTAQEAQNRIWNMPPNVDYNPEFRT